MQRLRSKYLDGNVRLVQRADDRDLRCGQCGGHFVRVVEVVVVHEYVSHVATDEFG